MSDQAPSEDPGPESAGPKRRKPDHRRAKTRRAIIVGAAELFSRQGIEQTTIDDIASAAGVSVGTVYFHFASKDGVVLALVARVLDRAQDYLAEARQVDSALERVLRSGDVYYRFATEQSVSFRFVTERLPGAASGSAGAEGSGVEDEVSREIARRVGEFIASIVGDLAQAMEDGEIDRIPIDEAMAFVWGSWNGVAGLVLRDDALAISPELGQRALARGRAILIKGLGGTLPTGLAPTDG